MEDPLYLPTPDLREGDIVLYHGMRILIDGPAKTYRQGSDTDDTYAWPGLVLNADELCDKGGENYNAHIASHLRGQWWEDRVPRPRKDDWAIQGNPLAHWHIEPRRDGERGPGEGVVYGRLPNNPSGPSVADVMFGKL